MKRRDIMRKFRLLVLAAILISVSISCGTRKCGKNGIDVCGPAVAK